MIYLVSSNQSLFKSDKYINISPEKAIELLSKEYLLGADTETQGIDPYTCKLLTIQLGTEDFQVVWDCTSYSIQLLKDILEDPQRTLIFWNAAFDLRFLYHHRILPPNIYDGMLAEKLMYLGYPAGLHSMSLKSAGEKYCGVSLDKTVRGQIITRGLTESVIIYAAEDVHYEIPIYRKQLKLLEEKDLIKAIKFENEFVKTLAYIQYCGVKLDIDRWKKKMINDSHHVEMAIKSLNDWIVASQTGKSTTIIYIPTYNRKEKDIDKDRKLTYLNKRVPEKDIIFPEGASFEAYEVIVIPLNTDKLYYSINLQGDLFEGFDTSPKCNIKWSSSQQVIPILEQLGFKVEEFDPKDKKVKKTASGKVIAKQINLCSIAYPYVQFKQWQKRCESFGDNYLKAVNSVSNRIHTNFNQLGTDTARLSSGGKPYNINLQQLPRDAETRACFIPEKGNVWISADYSGQESVITADVTNDPTLIELYTIGCKDMHSVVAKVCFDELKDIPVEDIKKLFPDLRQKAKGIEFTVFYGGTGSVIASNLNISKKEGDSIYNKLMSNLPGLKIYQDYCRREVLEKGYILLNPITKHKAFIYDFKELEQLSNDIRDPEYYEYLQSTSGGIDKNSRIKHLKQRIAASQKQSIDYRIQGRGSAMFKLASIKLFNYLKKNDLLFKVLYMIPAHDELNVECPKEISEDIAKVVVRCMEDGAKPFLKTLNLTADENIGNHWIH